MKSSRATGTGRALDRRKHPEMHGMAARQGEFQDSLSHVRSLELQFIIAPVCIPDISFLCRGPILSILA
jgi:hypothetical protein